MTMIVGSWRIFPREIYVYIDIYIEKEMKVLNIFCYDMGWFDSSNFRHDFWYMKYFISSDKTDLFNFNFMRRVIWKRFIVRGHFT